MKRIALAGVLLAVWPHPTAAQEALHVPRADQRPELDGRLDDAAWSDAVVLADWVQTTPGDNITPTGDTRLYLVHDDEALYMAVRATDPRGVRYSVHPRDQVTAQGQDWLGILLDTFDARRQAFGFALNPLGIQGDGIILEGGQQIEWDAIYQSEGRVDDDGRGYSLEVRVPFKSLRFSRQSVQEWGVSATRTYGRTGAEDTPWPLDRDLNCSLCQMRAIVLEGVEPGRNLELNPALVATTDATRPEPGAALPSYDAGFEPGLNAKYGVTSNLTLDATLNPDFSQVESDAGQLEVNNRFALFFPEKRPFFLEGADVFRTSITPPGASPFVRAPVNLIHSRTIIDPDWGVKLSGKTGRVGLGTIISRDAAPPLELPGAPTGSSVVIARSTVDVLDDGYVGAIFTGRRHQGVDDAVGGVDTRLRLGDNLVLRGLLASSRTRLGRDEPAMGLSLQEQADWQSRHWLGGVALIDVGRDFRAPLGFVPRTDQVMGTASIARIWRGTGVVQRIQPQLRYERIHEHTPGGDLFDAGDLVDELWEPSVAFTFARSTEFAIGAHRAYTFYDDRTFPAQHRLGFFAGSEAIDWLFLSVDALIGETVIFGDVAEDDRAVPGSLRQLVFTATLRPIPALRADLSLQSSRIWRRTDETQHASLYADAMIPRLKVEYQATRRLGLRTIAQWGDSELFRAAGAAADRETRLSLELLGSYVINAGSAIYVGWTDLQGGTLERPLAPQRRGGVAKATYVWRF